MCNDSGGSLEEAPQLEALWISKSSVLGLLVGGWATPLKKYESQLG